MPSPSPPPPILAARGLSRRFGSVLALDGADFAVHGGEVHALLGENGAGKSTLMNVLSGLLRPTDGQVLLDGTPVRWRSPREAARAGIGMVHQHFLLVPSLSVIENLLLGASHEKGGPLSYPAGAVLAEARSIAERLGWRDLPWNACVGGLPVGTQQRIEILKALRGQTRVLIFDEPTAVLSPTETPQLFATIRRLAGEARGVVFISHKLGEALALADTVSVLRRGRLVLRAQASETNAAALAAAMVRGKEALTPGPSPNAGRGEEETSWARAAEAVPLPDSPLPALGEGPGVRASPLTTPSTLQVTDLSLSGTGRGARPRLRDITFSVAPGEIFGVAGVDGNGQAELADCLAGLTRPDAGRVLVDGQNVRALPADFRRAGVAVVPADRQRRGLALSMSLTENLALGVHEDAHFRRGPFLRWRRLRERAADLIERFDVRASGPEATARSLSGGNQQKVVIARALAGNPRVIIAVNPTRGLDVGATAFVHDALRAARAAGAAVVLLSTELDELRALATERIAVLCEGAFAGVVPANAPRERIGLLMGGGGE